MAWDKVQEAYTKDADSRWNSKNRADKDYTKIVDFLNFISKNRRFIDLGGMSVGRSRISDFFDEKAKLMEPYFRRFILKEEPNQLRLDTFQE